MFMQYGNDFQEAIYQKALAVEFRLMGIDFMPKVLNGKDSITVNSNPIFNSLKKV